MKRSARTWLAVPMMAIAAGSACSSGRQDVETAPMADEAAAPGGTIQVEVENDLNPPRSVFVTFHSAGRVERQLGTILTGETVTFAVPNRHAIAPYHLVAESSGREQVVSRPIVETTASRIRWSLSTNSVRIDG